MYKDVKHQTLSKTQIINPQLALKIFPVEYKMDYQYSMVKLVLIAK